MPTLKQLLEELEELNVEPREIKLPPSLYDDFVSDAEEISEEDED